MVVDSPYSKSCVVTAQKSPLPSPTATLSKYVSGIEFDTLPAEVVDAAKLLVLDNVGCVIAGLRTGIGSAFH